LDHFEPPCFMPFSSSYFDRETAATVHDGT
jgi:hypothetical protein